MMHLNNRYRSHPYHLLLQNLVLRTVLHFNSARCVAVPVPQMMDCSKSSEICWDLSCGASPMSRPSPIRWFFSFPGWTMSERSSFLFRQDVCIRDSCFCVLRKLVIIWRMSHDLIPLDEDRNTRRNVDTDSGADDENARSAVPLRLPCEQCHTGVSAWFTKTLEANDQP